MKVYELQLLGLGIQGHAGDQSLPLRLICTLDVLIVIELIRRIRVSEISI